MRRENRHTYTKKVKIYGKKRGKENRKTILSSVTNNTNFISKNA
jgi:hypothetical protein